MPRVDPFLRGEVPGAVHDVFEILAAHVAVDRRPPVAPVSAARAVIDVEHDVSARREQVVEHVFPEVARPVLVRVLRVAGAVHEDNAGVRRIAARADHLGREQTRVDVHAVPRLERRHLRIDPRERPPRLRRRRRDLRRRRAGLVWHQVHLGRLVAVRVDETERLVVRRCFGLVRPRHRRDLRSRSAIERDGVHLSLAGMLLRAGDVKLPPVGREIRGRDLPRARRELLRLRVRVAHVERVQVHPPVALRQEPDAAVVRQELESGRSETSARFAHPRVVVQVIDDVRLAGVGVERDEPAILVVGRSRGGDHVLAVGGHLRHRPTDV